MTHDAALVVRLGATCLSRTTSGRQERMSTGLLQDAIAPEGCCKKAKTCCKKARTSGSIYIRGDFEQKLYL